jgi:DNA-binding Lrp family transcriptional regulator
LARTRLTDNEALVIGSAHLQADASVGTISRETGLREHTVRRCLESLRSREIITPYAVIDVLRLGFTDYGIYFSLSRNKGAPREDFLRWIIKRPQVAWVAELSGQFQYVVTYVAARAADVSAFLDELTANNTVRIVDKAVATRVGYRAFRAAYLSDRKSSVEEILSLRSERSVEISPADHAILAGISDLRHRSMSELARALKTPLSTLLYRIEKLRADGIIRGFMYRLNLEKLGYGLFRLLIFENGASRAFHKRLLSFCRDNKNIVGLVRCLGSWDYELRVELPDGRDLPALIDELEGEFEGQISRIQVISSLQARKLVAYPFKKLEDLRSAANAPD